MKRLLIVGIAAVLMTGTAAFAATAPTATTGSASAVTASGATVAGAVNPNGSLDDLRLPVRHEHQLRLADADSIGGLGNERAGRARHAERTRLAHDLPLPDRRHERLGLNSGSDQTFTTAAVPPTASVSSPSLVTSSSATLVGSVNPHGKSTVYSFQYGPTTSYGLQTASTSAGSGTSTTTVHGSLTNLTSGTTYHYRLVATSADGASASSDGTFETTGPSSSPNGTLPIVSEAGAVKVTCDLGAAERRRQPRGPEHDLVLPVRPEQLLRAADRAADDLGPWRAGRSTRS